MSFILFSFKKLDLVSQCGGMQKQHLGDAFGGGNGYTDLEETKDRFRLELTGAFQYGNFGTLNR